MHIACVLYGVRRRTCDMSCGGGALVAEINTQSQTGDHQRMRLKKCRMRARQKHKLIFLTGERERAARGCKVLIARHGPQTRDNCERVSLHGWLFFSLYFCPHNLGGRIYCEWCALNSFLPVFCELVSVCVCVCY